jgi:hypothetical protein
MHKTLPLLIALLLPVQYGGPPMWDQGPDRRGDRYDYPRGYIPPFERPRPPRPRGPDPSACIYYGNCGPQPEPYYPPRRW